ncbi:MAG: CRISPR-associated protein Cas2 [Pseudomonadota bacterium]
MNNLTISYDLYKQGQDYHAIIDTIKTFGSWARTNKSVWYVKSGLSASQAVERLKQVIDTNDSVYVVDSTNNEAAWFNLDPKVAAFLRQNWNAKSGLLAVNR